MKKKSPSKLSLFFKKYKLFSLTLILFFIVFPVLLISSIHFYQGVIVKPLLFGEKTNKLTKDKDQIYFEITAELIEIKSATENQKQRYIFDYSLVRKSELSTISSLNITAQLSPKYNAYNSNATSLGSRMASDNYSKLDIEFDFDMDQSRFPFLKSRGPFLYFKILFEETNVITGTTTPVVLFVKVNYTISDEIIRS